MHTYPVALTADRGGLKHISLCSVVSLCLAVLPSAFGCGSDAADAGEASPSGSADDMISWVAATATKLYASNDRSNPHIFHTSLANDQVWVDDGAPGMGQAGANTPGVIFDGTHYVIIAPVSRGGVWRYVEP